MGWFDWFRKKPVTHPEPKTIWTKSDIIQSWRSSFPGSYFNHKFEDAKYYGSPIEDIERVLRGSGVINLHYISEKGDCGDFAHLSKAAFIRDAWKDGKRRYPHMYGIIWATAKHIYLPTEHHAFCWALPRDGILRFIEPQNNRIWLASETKMQLVELILS